MNKQDWTYKKLGEIGTFQRGKGIKRADFVETGMPCIHYGQIHTSFGVSTNRHLSSIPSELFEQSIKASHGDVIIALTSEDVEGSCKATAWLGNYDIAISSDAAIFRHNLNSIYVSYYLRSKSFFVEKSKYARGFKVTHIKTSEIAEIGIPVPPIGEQERIVAELDLLSGIIEKKKEQLKAYDQLAQSIFYSMFGDPIDNPKGWETKKLGEVATQKLSYGSGASAIQYNGKIRYVRITDIREDGDLNSDIVSPDTFDEKYLLNEGDILFARSGATVGKTFQYKSRFGKCIFAGYLIRMIPNIEIVLPSFIFAYTKSSYYRSFVSKAQNAVAQPNINAKQYSDLLVPVPPLSLQEEFAEKIEAIERQKALVQQSIEEVQTMFDCTMDKYFG